MWLPVLILMTLNLTEGKKHTINWDVNMEPTLKEEKILNVMVDEWMDILCPYVSTKLHRKADLDLYINLYNVTKQQYETCEGGRKVLQCMDPKQETKLTTKFQERSPSPLGFIFQPGKTYYYLSKPSVQFEEDERKGCKNVMKLKVFVHAKNHRNYNTHKTDSDLKYDQHHTNHHHHQTDHGKEQRNLFRPAVKPIHSSLATSNGHNNSNKLSHLTLFHFCVLNVIFILAKST